MSKMNQSQSQSLFALLTQAGLKPMGLSDDVMVAGVTDDSRLVKPGFIFVAIDGEKQQGAYFIPQAIKQGAKVIVFRPQAILPEGGESKDVITLPVDDPKAVLRLLVPAFYHFPAKQVQVMAVTGTNGKTTWTYVCEAIFKAHHILTGVMGTINHRIAGRVFPSINTTPGFVAIQEYLAMLRDHQVPWAIMEASSHALLQGRLDGINVQVAAFTNLTQDHLDYHHDMENYFQAKALLFKSLSSQAKAVINIDDVYGQRLTKMTAAKVITVAVRQAAMFWAKDIHMHVGGTKMIVQTPQGPLPIQTRFIGEHNVYNILIACASAWAAGIPLGAIQNGIASLSSVPGRLEAVDAGQKQHVFIDYAHTPDGLANVLQAIRAISQEKIWVVFGCGGDRDKTKRPLMGEIASRLADEVIVTSDNPRTEDPQEIINDIVKGIKHHSPRICLDRREAIAQALALARPNEIILLAGKGHEDYQIIGTVKYPFVEQNIIKDWVTNHVHR